MRLNKLCKQISFLCIHYADSKQPLQSIDSVPHIEWHGEQLVRTVDLKHGDREYLFDARPRQLLCTVCRDLEQVLIKHNNYCSAVLLQRMQYYCSGCSTIAADAILLQRMQYYCSGCSTIAADAILLQRIQYYCSGCNTIAADAILLQRMQYYCSRCNIITVAPSRAVVLHCIVSQVTLRDSQQGSTVETERHWPHYITT